VGGDGTGKLFGREGRQQIPEDGGLRAIYSKPRTFGLRHGVAAESSFRRQTRFFEFISPSLGDHLKTNDDQCKTGQRPELNSGTTVFLYLVEHRLENHTRWASHGRWRCLQTSGSGLTLK